jgi:hypothetical protein
MSLIGTHISYIHRALPGYPCLYVFELIEP